MTLEGSLHSATIAKVAGALVGFVTRASLAEASCTGGLAESAGLVTASLPWHVEYEGFSGTLPNLTAVKLRVFEKEEVLRVLGVNCHYRPAAAGMQTILNVGTGGTITSAALESATQLVLISGPNPPCPPTNGDVAANGRFTVQGSTTSVTVRLI